VTSSSALKRFFGPLSGLPAWGGLASWGTWLSLEFAQPRLEVREAMPTTGNPRLRRRHASVVGEHNLWLDMCHWEILDGARRRFHSEQSRHLLRRAAAHLDGQIVVALSISVRPLTSEFHFDDGTRLIARRLPRADPDWELWHLYSPRNYLGLTSAGRLQVGWIKPQRLHSLQVTPTQIAV